MEIIILALIFIFCLIVSSKIKHKLPRIFIKIYICWWFVNLIISSFNPFNLYNVSFEIYILLVLNVLFFLIGFLVIPEPKRNRIFSNNQLSIENRFDKLLNSKKLLLVLLPFTIYIILKLRLYLSLLSSLSDENIRLLKYKIGLLFQNAVEILFYNFFVETMAFFTAMIICYCILYKKFRNLNFYLSLIFYSSYSLIGSGRGPIILLLFYFIFFALIKRYYSGNKSKINYIIILPIFILLIIVMSFQTSYRYGYESFNFESLSFGFSELLKHLIVYCVGSFRALQYGIDNYSSLQYSYGRFSLLGLEDIFQYGLKIIGITFNTFNLELQDILSSEFIIGYNNMTFNALFTCVFPFYTDFGIFGILIFSFSFGIFYKKILNEFIIKQNLQSLFGVLFLSVIAIYSLFTWKFSSVSPYIILTLLYFSKQKIKFNR